MPLTEVLNWVFVISILFPMIVFILRMGPQKWEEIFLAIAKALHPKPKQEVEIIALDPSIFNAKRKAINNEHMVWNDEFKRLAGHSWKYKPITVEPEIWDEAADETLRDWGGQTVRKTYLTKKCKHTLNEVCIHCDR